MRCHDVHAVVTLVISQLSLLKHVYTMLNHRFSSADQLGLLLFQSSIQEKKFHHPGAPVCTLGISMLHCNHKNVPGPSVCSIYIHIILDMYIHIYIKKNKNRYSKHMIFIIIITIIALQEKQVQTSKIPPRQRCFSLLFFGLL